jgi:murein DD-endopeptidase MepM/ murein hydrolase activator NlpD
MEAKKYIWPLPHCDGYTSYQGLFAAERKWDKHTGYDLYCEPEQLVVAMEDGVIVKIENFTGENATPPSPWWNDTKAVLIEGASGVIVYGEIRPLEAIQEGQKVKAGKILGRVITVLKKDKGLPMTMLHVELYKPGTRETVIWNIGDSQPDSLLDPTYLLDNAKKG